MIQMHVLQQTCSLCSVLYTWWILCVCVCACVCVCVWDHMNCWQWGKGQTAKLRPFFSPLPLTVLWGWRLRALACCMLYDDTVGVTPPHLHHTHTHTHIHTPSSSFLTISTDTSTIVQLSVCVCVCVCVCVVGAGVAVSVTWTHPSPRRCPYTQSSFIPGSH